MGPSKSSHWCPRSQKTFNFASSSCPVVLIDTCTHRRQRICYTIIRQTQSELCKLTCSAQLHSLTSSLIFLLRLNNDVVWYMRCRKTNDAQHHAIMALCVIDVPSVRLLRVGLRQQGAITWGRCYFAARGDFRPGAATFAMSWNPPAGRLFQWGRLS